MRKAKPIKSMIVVILAVCLLHPAFVMANQPVRVTVNGRVLVMDTPPVIRDGRTLVPLRAIFEALGALVEWDAATRTITGRRDGRTVKLQIGNPTAIVGNNFTALDVPPAVIGGRTMVPVRFVAEHLGARVNWDSRANTIIITALPNFTSVYSGPQRQRLATEEVSRLIRPAVVQIETHRGLGSGVFVAVEGLVLTNAHVARGSRGITVTTSIGERLPARLLKINNRTDLALLRVEAVQGRKFPIISYKAYIDSVQTGEEVLAFGSPRGLGWTVTRGVVSAKREMSPSLGAWVNDVLLIQHDAATAPGSSGGPLVDMFGDLIGVNTMGIRDIQGFNFAVPADQFYWLKEQADYSIRDDWFSYFAEYFLWREEWNEIVPMINEAMQAPWGQRKIDLLNQSIPLIKDLRARVSAYQPLYQDIISLQLQYLSFLDASIEYNSYILSVALNRLSWSDITNDALWNNLQRARDAYSADYGRIEAQFR